MKTVSLSDLSEENKRALFTEMCEKKRISNTTALGLALLLGLLSFLFVGYILPGIAGIVQSQQQPDIVQKEFARALAGQKAVEQHIAEQTLRQSQNRNER